MKSEIDLEIERAVQFVEDNGLTAILKVSEFNNKKGSPSKGKTFSINIKGGVRPVSVWPIQGTVFSSKVENKGGKGWKFSKSFNVKKLTFEDAIDVAIRVAKKGE